MVIHFTKKLRDKLHLDEVTEMDVPAGPHLRWYARLLRARRLQYIVTTNAASLFSVVVYGRGLTDSGDYILRFLSELRDHLDDLGLQLIYKRVIAPSTGAVTLAKAVDRSVLGSMNDMVRLCKDRLDLEDVSPWELSKHLNGVPFGALKYGFPREVFPRMPLE